MRAQKLAASGNLSEQVIRHLVDYIRRHKLTGGAQIPSEVRLSEELSVSRGIVREAYRSLASAGVLDIANGRSPRVGHLNSRSFTQFLQHALSTDQASPAQVFDVRSTLEVRAAELAAERCTDDDAAALLREAAAMKAAGNQRERFVRADLHFHEVVGRATGNPLFGLLGTALRESLALTIRAGFDSRRSHAELDRVVEIHLRIADAIARHDREAAATWMTTHFNEAREFVLRPPPRPTRVTRVRVAAVPT